MKDTVDQAMSKLPVTANPQNTTLCITAFTALQRSMALQQHGLGICVEQIQALYCRATRQQYNHKIMKVLPERNWLLKDTLWHPDDLEQVQPFESGVGGWWYEFLQNRALYPPQGDQGRH